jgi:general stress protein CsbA
MIYKASNKNWIGIILITILIISGAALNYNSYTQALLLIIVAVPVYHVIFGLGILTKELRVSKESIEVDYYHKSKQLKRDELREVRLTNDSLIFRSINEYIVVPKSCLQQQDIREIINEFESIAVIKEGNKFI